MDTNIVQSVYNTLEESTTEIDKIKAEYSALDAKIKEGRYSNDTLKKEIFPRRDEIKRKIENECTNAIRKAEGLVSQYREEAEHLNDLDPSKITDDIKLLTAGIPLHDHDILAIINRNQGNRTMMQLALRYAEEHNIDVGSVYIGGQAEKENADVLNGIIKYFSEWIGKDGAHDMLQQFFDIVK